MLLNSETCNTSECIIWFLLRIELNLILSANDIKHFQKCVYGSGGNLSQRNHSLESYRSRTQRQIILWWGTQPFQWNEAHIALGLKCPINGSTLPELRWLAHFRICICASTKPGNLGALKGSSRLSRFQGGETHILSRSLKLLAGFHWR